MTLKIHAIFLLIFFIQLSLTQIPPVVPLTNALTAIYCHNSDESGIMTIRCGPNEKIRMLDAFDATAKNRSRLPSQCSKGRMESSKNSSGTDCKVHTSFISACSGRENCTLHMQRIRLNSIKDNCQNELVDYTMAFFECISDVFIHDVCSSQVVTSAWGTLQTPNFPNPYTSSDDCWCKLSTQLQHRLLLSIIVFQLIPYDQHCAGAGLYLQSSDEQRSTQCTYLQQGHNYLSDTNSLYINFYSRTSTVRGGFWIIYEASHPTAEVHLHCGSREKIGVPSSATTHSISVSSVSTPFDHGWSRLAFNNPPNPTTLRHDHMMRLHMSMTTPSSHRPNSQINTSTAIGAFTYPHGALTTFEVAYGPRGWYLKHPFSYSRRTWTIPLRTKITTTPTTSNLPIIKWDYTWMYRRPSRTRVLVTRRRSTTIVTPTTTTTTITTTLSTTSTTTAATTTTTTTTTTSTTTTSTTETTTTMTTTFTEKIRTISSTTPVLTTTLRTVTAQQRLLFTHKPWIYYNFTGFQSHSTSGRSFIKSTTQEAKLSGVLKSTLPLPTPWYSPAGPYDWWQWQWYTTKGRKSSPSSLSSSNYPTTITTTRSTHTTTTTRKTTRRTTTNVSVSNKTNSHTKMILDRFVWPDQVLNSIETSRSDDFKKEYQDWLQYLTTNGIQNIFTSVVMSTSTPIIPHEQYPQMNSLPTESNWKVVTVDTPPSKRQHQSYSLATERSPIAGQSNGDVTASNVHNVIRRVIEQRNKKHAIEYGWLSKTDLTIVAVSILFVILLAIINLILFAVRKHRHRLQGRHLLSTSISSSLDDRRRGGNGHSQSSTFGDATNSLINVTNGNNKDILPAVGEIVIWDEKDQGGYMIDNNGAWAKIEGRQWFGSNIFKNCSKTSITKSFRSRFRFARHFDKKNNSLHQPQSPISPKNPQQTFKFPLLMDTATLSPVPEAEDYESSELSLSDVVIRSSTTIVNQSNKRQQHQPLIKSERRREFSSQTSKTVQALIHNELQNDDYYKRITNTTDGSNDGAMAERTIETSSIGDQETDRSLGNEMDVGGSVILSVPTMLRGDDDIGNNTDGGESIYNPNYALQSAVQNSQANYLQPNNHAAVVFANKSSVSTFKPTTNNSVIIGFCQTEFQPLDPKLLFQPMDKTSLIEQQQTQFIRCTQSVQLSTYDSGFVDDQTIESATIANPINGLENNLTNEQNNPDDILLTKSEAVEDDDDDEDEDDDLPGNILETNRNRNSKPLKWKTIAKRVSFQEGHLTQPCSSLSPSINPETSPNPLDTYDAPATDFEIPITSPLTKSFLSSSVHNPISTTDNNFTDQRQASSIDNEDTTQTIIMNHLHSVKSLKKFFETKMVVQRSGVLSCQTMIINDEKKLDRSSISTDSKITNELEQRQEIMNKVLDSLKKKTATSQNINDTPDPNGRCSATTNSSYNSNLTQNLAIHRHYSRRFRSSSTSNNSLYPSGNIITHINPSHSQYNKRAHSHDRQHYQTTDHHHFDKWKYEQQRAVDSDEDDNISENSMLWQARTKLNEFVTRTKKNQQQSPYYTTCANAGTPIDDLDIYDENESVTAETRF